MRVVSWVGWIKLFPTTHNEEFAQNQERLKTDKSGRSVGATRRKDMKRHAYIEFREKVEKALQREKDGLTWGQLKKKGEIDQTRLCYTWVRQLEDEIGLTRERHGHNVYWKLEKK